MPGTPGPSSSIRISDVAVDRARARSYTGRAAGREFERVLEQVDEHALDLRRVDLDERQVGRAARRPPARARRGRRAPGRRSRRAARRPAPGPERRPTARRERSSRLPTTRSRRSASARIVSSRSSRSSARARAPGSSRLSTATRIAVSGERRSWLTERRSAVFIGIAAPERLRLECLVLEALAVDRNREQRGERGAGSARHAVSSSAAVRRNVERADEAITREQRRASATPGDARECRTRSRRSGACRTVAAPSAMRSSSFSTEAPERRTVESSARRTASRRRCSASVARRRAREASSATTSPVTRNTSSPTQFSSPDSVNVEHRRQEQVVEDEHAHDATVAIANIRPQTTAIGSTAST